MSYIPDRKIVELTRQINDARELFEQTVAERDKLQADLAAARAELAAAQVRLEVVAEWVASLHELRKEQPAEFGAWWWDEAFKRIDAALAGEGK
jgi:predicted nuclease with TOPRIM domain